MVPEVVEQDVEEVNTTALAQASFAGVCAKENFEDINNEKAINKVRTANENFIVWVLASQVFPFLNKIFYLFT
jgi:hypothetical protein